MAVGQIGCRIWPSPSICSWRSCRLCRGVIVPVSVGCVVAPSSVSGVLDCVLGVEPPVRAGDRVRRRGVFRVGEGFDGDPRFSVSSSMDVGETFRARTCLSRGGVVGPDRTRRFAGRGDVSRSRSSEPLPAVERTLDRRGLSAPSSLFAPPPGSMRASRASRSLPAARCRVTHEGSVNDLPRPAGPRTGEAYTGGVLLYSYSADCLKRPSLAMPRGLCAERVRSLPACPEVCAAEA